MGGTVWRVAVGWQSAMMEQLWTPKLHADTSPPHPFSPPTPAGLPATLALRTCLRLSFTCPSRGPSTT